jgi:hypothetical protein
MRIPQAVNIEDRSIDVHIGGPGFGEGMFIVIGKTIGIGIDCCSSFYQERSSEEGFLEQRIRELPSHGFVLWILTHYHYDHFHCLFSVLKHFSDRIRAAVFPLDYNPADLSYLAEQMSEFPDAPLKVHRAQREYNDLRNLLKLPPFNQIVSRVQGIPQWLSLDLILPTNEVVPLRVKICSSSSDVYDKHVGISAAAVRDSGSSTSRSLANRGSYIVHCELGEFEGLFLGDAGTERVEQLVAHELIGKDGIDCLKVGHHGSLDATNDKLLQLCAPSEGNHKEQHALIAPYKTAGLPNDEVIELLKTFKYTIHRTRGNAEVKARIGEEGSMLTQVSVDEAVSAGSDIISLNFGF